MGSSQGRLRRYHNRSRTGCITCKKRHVRCDEARPTCKKCLVGGKECEYPKVELWSSDDSGVRRPNFVGQQAWSAVWQLPKDPRSADPFDSLPTGMPLKSRQLFQYFVQVHEEECNIPLSKKHIKSSIYHPDSFRGVLLLAALHFSWKTGDLREYESTYLTHKIECIRSVNSLLGNSSNNLDAIRSYLSVIATLCLVETSTDNLPAAEAHLEGLMALVDAEKVLWPINDVSQDVNGVLQRYIMICIQEVLRLRTRIKRSSDTQPNSHDELDAAFTDDQTRGAFAPIQELQDRLLALWLMPYLQLASRDLRAEDIDATEFIDYLRILTEHRGGCRTPRVRRHQPSKKWAGTSGVDISNYFLWGVVENGKELYSAGDRDKEMLQCSWVGLSISTGFYIYGLMGVASAQEAIEGRALRWLVRMLQRDIEQSFEVAVVKRTRSGEFWIWKVILGAFGVVGAWMTAQAAGNVEKSIFGGEATFLELRAWFFQKIRDWSKATGITEWEDAKDAMAEVVWPAHVATEQFVVMIWHQALAGEGGPP